MWPNPQFSADLVIFTEEILNGKLHFCAVIIHYNWRDSICEMNLRKFAILIIFFKNCNPVKSNVWSKIRVDPYFCAHFNSKTLEFRQKESKTINNINVKFIAFIREIKAITAMYYIYSHYCIFDFEIDPIVRYI